MACRQCKPTVATWKKIHVNATICRCSALEILLQKPLHLQFLTAQAEFPVHLLKLNWNEC